MSSKQFCLTSAAVTYYTQSCFFLLSHSTFSTYRFKMQGERSFLPEPVSERGDEAKKKQQAGNRPPPRRPGFASWRTIASRGWWRLGNNTQMQEWEFVCQPAARQIGFFGGRSPLKRKQTEQIGKRGYPANWRETPDVGYRGPVSSLCAIVACVLPPLLLAKGAAPGFSFSAATDLVPFVLVHICRFGLTGKEGAKGRERYGCRGCAFVSEFLPPEGEKDPAPRKKAKEFWARGTGEEAAAKASLAHGLANDFLQLPEVLAAPPFGASAQHGRAPLGSLPWRTKPNRPRKAELKSVVSLFSNPLIGKLKDDRKEKKIHVLARPKLKKTNHSSSILFFLIFVSQKGEVLASSFLNIYCMC
eukprot:gene8262-5782_t